MKESGRIQAVIELISAILENSKVPADNLITHYFRHRRYIGSADRRFIAELTYNIIRAIPALPTGELSDGLGRIYCISYLFFKAKRSPEEIETLFNGSDYAPNALTKQERSLFKLLFKEDDLTQKYAIPLWLFKRLPNKTEAFWSALNQIAPFDIRINPLLTNREAVMKTLLLEGIEAPPTPWSPWGLRITERRPMANNKLFEDGHIEVQDEGSQMLSFLCDAKPGEQVLDYCAGAGGKSLGLAATMANKGQLVLSDISDSRLKRAKERLRRAHVHNYSIRNVDDTWFKRQTGRFDCVLVDAPCSGTGTWRRNPDLKIRFTEDDLNELLLKQQEILTKAATYVKPGGRLIYATCSVLNEENEDQVSSFLQNHKDFALSPINRQWEKLLPIPYPGESPLTLNLLPHSHYTDGFFVALFTRF